MWVVCTTMLSRGEAVFFSRVTAGSSNLVRGLNLISSKIRKSDGASPDP